MDRESNGQSKSENDGEHQTSDTVVYHVFQVGDPRFQRVLPDGSTFQEGIRLATLRKLLNGDEGYVTDFAGSKHTISLKPWTDADPETTFVIVEIPSLLSDVQARFRKPSDIPGYSTTGERSLKLEVLQAGDPRLLGIGPQARLVINGISITEMRRRLGGEEGHIPGPGGKKYYLSLEPWSGADPDTTFLQPTFFPENRPKA
jgi:hypothetical protein